jgi:hypothetical protein
MDLKWDSSIDFNTDNALACGSGMITVSVNTTVPWAVYKSR